MERYEDTLVKLRQLLSNNGAAVSGERLPPERILASELQVGRRSLRRALSVLEDEGQITRQQGRGTFINAGVGVPTLRIDRILEHTNPLEVMEVRLSVEPVMARLTALRASRCDIDRLSRLAEDTATAREPAEYEAADAAFHRRIAEASRNALFLSLYDTLSASRNDAAWRRLGENAHCYKRQAVYANFHREIAKAIAARDGAKAERLMYDHLCDVQQHIQRHAFPMKVAAESEATN
jgi:DNA-binding FadR family transcriptional regulator